MGIKEELERYLADIAAAGLSMDQETLPAGVFFRSEQAARVFADKFNKELLHVVGGWIARNRPPD